MATQPKLAEKTTTENEKAPVEAPKSPVVAADTTAAVDKENESVLKTAEEVAPPIIPAESTSAPVPAPDMAPPPVETSEEVEESNEPEVDRTVKIEEGEDKFDDVPI
jgi:hypothetical protein